MLTRMVSAITQPLAARRSHAGRRVLTLLVLITALCLLPLRLSPQSARVLTTVVLALVALSALTTVAAFKRLLGHFIEGDRLRPGGSDGVGPRARPEARLFGRIPSGAWP